MIFLIYIYVIASCVCIQTAQSQPHSSTHTLHRHHEDASVHHHLHSNRTWYGQYQRSILKIPPPIPNKHRAFYQWNRSANAFQQNFFELPLESPYLSSNHQFFNQYSPVNYTHPAKDYSKGQWPLLVEIFAGKTQGYYVDLTTKHWQAGSNTAGLDEFYNWTGLCIEPINSYWEGILSNRKCTLIGSAVSPLNYETVSTTVTLNSILDTFYPLDISSASPVYSTHSQHHHHHHHRHIIDYLSLDIDTAEYELLQQFDFNHTVFHVITLQRPSDVLHDLLIRQGYWFVAHIIPGHTPPAGSVLYVHFSCPKFMEIMNKHRAHPQLRYSYQGKEYNPSYLLIPAWPPSEIMKLMLSMSSSSSSTSGNGNTKTFHIRSIFEKLRRQYSGLLVNRDIFTCGGEPSSPTSSTQPPPLFKHQFYFYQGHRAHGIPNQDVLAAIEHGRRSFADAIALSRTYCQTKVVLGKELDRTTAQLPEHDAFWSLAADVVHDK